MTTQNNSINSSSWTSVLDFWNTPWTNIAVVTITWKTTIKPTSRIKAQLSWISTSTHNAYEHLIVPLTITCWNIVDWVWFDIYWSSDLRLDWTFNVNWEFNN